MTSATAESVVSSHCVSVSVSVPVSVSVSMSVSFHANVRLDIARYMMQHVWLNCSSAVLSSIWDVTTYVVKSMLICSLLSH